MSVLASTPLTSASVNDAMFYKPLFLNNKRVVCSGKTQHVRSGDKTKWSNCVITFGADNMINGSGVSVFNGQDIPFIVMGTYHPQMGIGKIVKTHLDADVSPLVYHITVKKSSNHADQLNIEVFNNTCRGVLCAAIV